MEEVIPSSVLHDLEGSELASYEMDLLGGRITFHFSVMEDIEYCVEFREIHAFHWKTDFVLGDEERYHPELFGLFLRKAEQNTASKIGFWERITHKVGDSHFTDQMPYNIILDFTAAGMFFLQAGRMIVNGREYRLLDAPVRRG